MNLPLPGSAIQLPELSNACLCGGLEEAGGV
jgi:hypothetical protein